MWVKCIYGAYGFEDYLQVDVSPNSIGRSGFGMCTPNPPVFFVTAWQKKSRPKNCLIKPPPVIQGSLNGTHFGGIKLDANVVIGHFGRFLLVLLVWVGVI